MFGELDCERSHGYLGAPGMMRFHGNVFGVESAFGIGITISSSLLPDAEAAHSRALCRHDIRAVGA